MKICKYCLCDKSGVEIDFYLTNVANIFRRAKYGVLKNKEKRYMSGKNIMNSEIWEAEI